MHPEAFAFLQETLTPDRVEGKRILELGSYIVNGSPRPLCAGAAAYVGVDRRAGPGVDTVDPDDSFDGKGKFDLVISTETLEHAEDPQALIASAHRALKPGGMLVLTAAGPHRTPHGCDGGEVGDEHYEPITTKALKGWLADWSEVEVRYGTSHGKTRGDVYATAIKPAEAAKEVTGRKVARDKDAE